MWNNSLNHRNLKNKSMRDEIFKANALIKNANNLKRLTKSQSSRYFLETFHSSMELSSYTSRRDHQKSDSIDHDLSKLIIIIYILIII